MPHVPSPIKKTSPQITSVEETISSPAWRSASPKKRSTRRPVDLAHHAPMKAPMSPAEVSHSRGNASSPSIT